MTFEEFWNENYEGEFGICEPYYGIAQAAYEAGENAQMIGIEKMHKENCISCKDKAIYCISFGKNEEREVYVCKDCMKQLSNALCAFVSEE